MAAVHGNAIGIGTTMLLHCDLVYVAPNARLITPFVNIALVPEAGSTYLLQGRIGYARAYEMFALGEPMDGATAASLGLVNAVVPLEELHAKARTVAQKLARQPAGSLAKALFSTNGLKGRKPARRWRPSPSAGSPISRRSRVNMIWADDNVVSP